jgi:hypothetical protein
LPNVVLSNRVTGEQIIMSNCYPCVATRATDRGGVPVELLCTARQCVFVGVCLSSVIIYKTNHQHARDASHRHHTSPIARRIKHHSHHSSLICISHIYLWHIYVQYHTVAPAFVSLRNTFHRTLSLYKKKNVALLSGSLPSTNDVYM